jgi:hypothetical protein
MTWSISSRIEGCSYCVPSFESPVWSGHRKAPPEPGFSSERLKGIRTLDLLHGNEANLRRLPCGNLSICRGLLNGAISARCRRRMDVHRYRYAAFRALPTGVPEIRRSASRLSRSKVASPRAAVPPHRSRVSSKARCRRRGYRAADCDDGDTGLDGGVARQSSTSRLQQNSE